MKVLHLLFTMMFISTLVVIPAQARGAGEYGYLPLVTQADPSMPLGLQAQRAFNRLLPDVLAAQHSGAILAFEPDFSAGILKIEYAAGARASVPASIHGLDSIHAAIALVPHATPVAAKPRIVISPIFDVYLYSSCFLAGGLGASSHIIGSLRNSAGQVVANYSGYADSGGFLYDCLDSSGPFVDVMPGYTLTFIVYSSGAVYLGTFNTIAPKMAFTAFNKNTSVMSGSGPANIPYSIEWYHPNLDAGNTALSPTLTGTVQTNGHWSIDFGTTPFRGDDSFQMWLTQDSTFYFVRYFYIPYMYCLSGGNYCSLTGFPFQAASVSVVHHGAAHTFTGKFTSGGYFDTYLINAAGAPIYLAAGDKISGNGVPSYKLANLTATPNYLTSVVSGQAPANKFFYVWVRDVINGLWHSRWTASDSTGNYSADFSSSLSLSPAFPYTYEVEYIDPATGNWSDKYIAVGP